MFKLNALAGAVALALVLPTTATAEVEVSGEIKIERSVFAEDGDTHESGDAMKNESTLKLFINSDVGEDSSFHAEVLLSRESEAASERLEGGESDGQYELLREFYFDTNLGDWFFRLGKQQVVWGTADGIKLLDIINPTDFRELNQNAAEDSRIPVWMINAETDFSNGGNLQLIVSEAKTNLISGLDENGDAGAPFLFKGVDSITGARNGFLNVASSLSRVAASFNNASEGGFFAGVANPSGLTNFTGVSVDGFASSMVEQYDLAATPADPSDDFVLLPGLASPLAGGINYGNGNGNNGTNTGFLTAYPGQAGLANIAQNGLFAGDPNANNDETNLMPVDGTSPTGTAYNSDAPTSAFEYMANTTFATFNSFAGTAGPGFAGGFTTDYVSDYKDDTEVNFGARYKNSTESGVNFSLNVFQHKSSNPTVNMSWHDAVTGEELDVIRAASADVIVNATGVPGTDGQPDFADTSGTSIAAEDIPNQFAAISVLLQNDAGEFYGNNSPNPLAGATTSANDVVLRFTEETHDVTSIGGSFDMALDGMSVPIILRGEVLYDIGEKQAVVDKRLLAIGDLSNALKTEDADMFKYVLGIDITVMTNLLVSTQLIQMYNLDYIDESRTCTTQGDLQVAGGGPAVPGATQSRTFDCSKYTGDSSTLSMTNGLNKGDEVETFVSFFLSKPFGDDFQHRWNNIIIAENGGGYWNRFDVEYGFNDELVGTVELNKYWGDEDTTFGQFKTSSNVQLGLKYLF